MCVERINRALQLLKCTFLMAERGAGLMARNANRLISSARKLQTHTHNDGKYDDDVRGGTSDGLLQTPNPSYKSTEICSVSTLHSNQIKHQIRVSADTILLRSHIAVTHVKPHIKSLYTNARSAPISTYNTHTQTSSNYKHRRQRSGGGGECRRSKRIYSVVYIAH